MKPNLTELIQMINYSLQNGLIKSGKSMVSTIVSNIVSNRIDSLSTIDDTDISDIRILANALLRVMYHGTPRYTNKQSVSTNYTGIVQGKHIIVSLGKRGILWCCPARFLTPEDRSLIAQLYPNHDCIVVSGDEEQPTVTVHIPVLEVIPGEKMKGNSSNGAGDAFCAGMLYGIFHSSQTLNKDLTSSVLLQKTISHSNSNGSSIQRLYPNLANMKMGLQNSRLWLLRK
jgi:hypothetical protein